MNKRLNIQVLLQRLRNENSVSHKSKQISMDSPSIRADAVAARKILNRLLEKTSEVSSVRRAGKITNG